MTTSPLAPKEFPRLPAIEGVQLATSEAGFVYNNRDDLLLASFVEGTTVAGVFTQSLCPGAPVEWSKQILPKGKASALVCNAGNANAFTGTAGEATTKLSANLIADELRIRPEEVFLASTGVIGEPLDNQKFAASLPPLATLLRPSSSALWEKAAKAICTTDTYAKGSFRCFDAGTIVGIAKGSGMIAPDMATLLSFIFTDVAISAELLQEMLTRVVAKSFNSITVDSDTSTSDTVLLFATGAQQAEPILSETDARIPQFMTALEQVATDLAHQIVKDGEGASKFIEVTVTGAASNHAAKNIALSIGNSPLVKTALGAEDANWGRILMAIGKSGEAAERDKIVLHLGDIQVTEAGAVLQTYNEAAATNELRESTIKVKADVGVGEGKATIWTCDLTHRYVEINASYRS